MIWEFGDSRLSLQPSVVWLFDTDLCSKCAVLMTQTTGSTGRIFCSDGKCEVRWMTRRWRGRLSLIHSKEVLPQQEARSERRAKSEESRESLSEDPKRGTSRWKWKRDEENWEKELGTVVGKAEWEKKREGTRGNWRETSIWKLVVLMAKYKAVCE